ncbi:GNAT family N-acetyltransferase [Anaeromyxobacter sp. SG66]|uniref:GNAT family N-acetyltransferase n=1 Tax=Anaeromyxobacter sp. SG66 TaxID=2925410 RepID=UPI001F5A8A13|nr:GNAT family N-acetyltransferase [Anaeromyxobacter sp. SG66]
MVQTAETLLAPAHEPAGSRYRVEELQGRAAFEALRDEWNGLLARGPVDVPFARHEWISAWLDAFAPDAPLRVLVARTRAGRAAGMAPLLLQRERGVTRLVAPANDHSCRVEWVLGEDAPGAVAALWGHLRDRIRWDVLVLRDVPREGPTSVLLEAAARADRHLAGRWESLRTPYVELSEKGAEERTSAKFRANLRRRARRLGELGAVALTRVDGAEGLDVALAEFFALEASGWKGQGGTAIALAQPLVQFYARIARDAAQRGALAVRALTLDGRAIAVHLGVVHRGVYYLPKTAYDERLGQVSPGQLLQREVLAECEARGLSRFDFLGPDMEWKRDWAPAHAPHDWLYVYRPSFAGRAMHTLKHRVRPAVKEALSWWR